MQLNHFNTSFPEKKHAVILACDAVNSPANIGGLFRLADSFGIQKLLFGGTLVNVNSARLKRTARATQNWISMEDDLDLVVELKKIIAEGYMPIALEITKNSLALNDLKIPKNIKIVVVLGDEQMGISPQVLEICGTHVHIPMYGKNSSMNVVQAASIALYEITKQLNSYG
ncbi:TrmH family RNA methyltransferase [Aquimarina agarivorans]|uniref:TrmH family RNA methyltransferase n=1 Tax=Aquimarina agarivorans TaxID=980584 RepID=UPI000248E79E|nr:TrmH family RNA methyltransferase [Aquimarina agarivorans]